MFIAVYTHKIKEYCDVRFLENLKKLTGQIHIVDNTRGEEYFERLKSFGVGKVYHLNIPQHPLRTQFLRNVCQSVNYLRGIFLKTNLQHFFIVESDVLPPADASERFLTHIRDLEENEINWGCIGGKYYFGWHRIHKKGYWKRGHVLSGCTVYRREAIQKGTYCHSLHCG